MEFDEKRGFTPRFFVEVFRHCEELATKQSIP